jgi:RecB family exonuclease
VITPRTTRLRRVPDLQALHRTIAACLDDSAPSWRSAVLVPTTAAGEALARTLERATPAVRPVILTRDDLYVRLHEALADAPVALSAFEREVLLTSASKTAERQGSPPPFRLRPGLVVEMLAFYDELRRRDRSVADFDRLTTDSLLPSVDVDRGAERLYRQTRFLADAFREFERLVASSGRVDEHALRHVWIAGDRRSPYERIVVTVADQSADARGLWTADFDLLARLPGLRAIDVVATENVLAAGFHERLHDLLPGIEEDRSTTAAVPPRLVVPAKEGDAPRWFVCRDREEELADVVRLVSASEAPDRVAVVFQRPLPYLYLARPVFGAARLPYRALDALPLAAEPFAAALDAVFAFLLAEGNRSSTIDLLRSPHWRFPQLEGSRLSIGEDVAALDAHMRELKYLGGWDRLAALAAPDPAGKSRREAARRQRASVALAAAAAAGDALRPVREATTASSQIHALLAFVHAHERLPDPEASWSAAHLRTRAAVLEALESLARAHERHDDAPLAMERLSGAVRRWIEGQTFAPRTGSAGVALLDAPAACYADVDEIRIVGLVEPDWPERPRRSIFYPASLLSQLGWPNDADRLRAARARFQDLLRLARHRVSVSTFTLDDDAIVPGSSFLEEIEASGLEVERQEPRVPTPVFSHEVLFDLSGDKSASEAEIVGTMIQGDSAAWLALRASRSPAASEEFRGAAGPRVPVDYAVSHVERYLDCPFKYFSARVLRLDEEREDESGLSPLERGQLLHEVFETFFRRWADRGGTTITTANLDEALELFASVAEATLARLPEADRALERTYLLGSAAAAGLGERAFTVEIEQEAGVVERLLEHPLEGTFSIRGEHGPQAISLRAKADRIDLLDDGTLRVIDYKLSRAPKPSRALQLPIYGACAEQRLKGRHGRDWQVSRAGYVAFKERNAFVSICAPSTPVAEAIEDGERRLVDAIGAIERGAFPVDPDEPYRCRWCGYAGVCRKDYVGDE